MPKDSPSQGVLLSVVEDAFSIEGLGCVMIPGIPDSFKEMPVIHRGAAIALRRPDGSRLNTTIKDFPLIRREPRADFIPILLPFSVTKSEVPIGTEVWYFPTHGEPAIT